MSEMQKINQALAKAKRRRFTHRVWTGFWQGLLFGVLVWLVSVAIFKIFPLPSSFLLWGQIAAAVVLGVRVIIGLTRFDSVSETARWIDEKHQLKQRLSSALEFSGKPSANAEWNSLMLKDAATHAESLDMAKVLPLRIPTSSKWIALLAVMAIGMGFVPEYRSEKQKQAVVDKEIMEDTGREMAKVIRKDLNERPPVSEPVQQAMEDAAILGEKLSQAKLKRAEALKEISSVTDKLKQDAERLSQDPALKRMQQAARETNGSESSPAEALQKKMEDLKKELEGKNVDPEKLAQMLEQMEQLQKQAAALEGNNSPKAQEARNQISKSLADLNRQAMEMGLGLDDQLQAAMEALASLQSDRFMENMELAMDEMEKMEDLARALEQMAQQAEQLGGRDLAEQLEKGQAEMAKNSLQKMMQKLQSGGMSEEDLKKMQEEISRAIDPASPYGKVGEFLKNASQQMQQGDKAGASESLAQAAEEIDRLMEQFGDMQSMAATMKALQAAQMSIANGLSWGECFGNGQGQGNQIRVGKGGKPGKGVGTWANETGWQYMTPPDSGLWDNSGLQRPDMAGRGISDRGDAVAPDNLLPDQVKGQFTPGGQMPSITLKGVSIKGQSQVSYQEVVSGEQANDQSAQNQDKVPRAYQQAVKNYFGDAE